MYWGGLLRLCQWQMQETFPPANAGDIRDAGLIPGLGRSPGRGHLNPLQYSCPENPMDRAAWWATVRRVAKSQTRLKGCSTHSQSDTVSFSMAGVGLWFLVFLFLKTWSIVNLQYCVNFKCTAKWSSYTHTHTYICIHFFLHIYIHTHTHTHFLDSWIFLYCY